MQIDEDCWDKHSFEKEQSDNDYCNTGDASALPGSCNSEVDLAVEAENNCTDDTECLVVETAMILERRKELFAV